MLIHVNKRTRKLVYQLGSIETQFNQGVCFLSISLVPYRRQRNAVNQFAIVCIDVFSRYVFARATAENVCEFLEKDVLYHFHAPEVLISDNGKQFVSKTFQELLKKYQIEHQ